MNFEALTRRAGHELRGSNPADADANLDANPDTRSPWPGFFVVRGSIGEQRVRAAWFCGGLEATTALRVRADLLVRLGETFQTQREGPIVLAGLEEPLAAMLTVIRSCDRLLDARFGPVEPRQLGVRYQRSDQRADSEGGKADSAA